MARTIESPGIEINEIDLSNITQLPVGTNILIHGFAASGPVQELVNITSVGEYERIFGLPTNPAERYAYTSVRQILASPGNLIFNRLPYGSGAGTGTANQYSVLAFPYVVVPGSTATWLASSSAWTSNLNDGDTYQGVVVGAPTLITLPATAYDAFQEGDIGTVTEDTSKFWYTTWSSASANTITTRGDAHKSLFIVSNDLKTSIETDYSGYYLAITDNTGLSDTSYTKIKSIRSRLNGADYTIPSASLTFNLTSTGSAFSTSDIIENGLGFDFKQSSYDDMFQVTLTRLRPNFLDSTGTGTRTKLDQVYLGSIPGSLDRTRIDTVLTPYNPVGATVFIDTAVDRYTDNYITLRTNPVIANTFSGKIARMVGDPNAVTVLSLSATYGFDISIFSADRRHTIADAISGLASTEAMFSIGEYEPCTDSDYKIIGNVGSKLDRGFALAENKDLIPLDIVCDAGLSTIEAISNGILAGNIAPELGSVDIFDDKVSVNLTVLKNSDFTTATGDDTYDPWVSIYNKFYTFCAETRKDCMFIIDPLRHIFVQGKDTKVSSASDYSFSSDILIPLRNLTNSTNSSYGATYANWAKVLDTETNDFNWEPFSAFQAAIMARTDAVFQPWRAPAGLNNGVVRGITDVAIAPNQKERDLLYRYSLNPVANLARDGFVVFGQKTLQSKPSAFDRINVRRLFLSLEKATRQVARYFVFEPNTVFTRTRLVNVLKPIFENAKNNEGVYDYLIVCDERNNTPDVIDRNELVVDIYIKPVRAAEFILFNFIATRTGDDFSQLIGV